MNEIAKQIAAELISMLKSKQFLNISDNDINYNIKLKMGYENTSVKNMVDSILSKEKLIKHNKGTKGSWYELIQKRHTWNPDEISLIRANNNLPARKMKEYLFKDNDDITVKAIQRKKDQLRGEDMPRNKMPVEQWELEYILHNLHLDNKVICQVIQRKPDMVDTLRHRVKNNAMEIESKRVGAVLDRVRNGGPKDVPIKREHFEFVRDLARIKNHLSNKISDKTVAESLKPFDDETMWKYMPYLNKAIAKTINDIGTSTWDWFARFSSGPLSKDISKEEFNAFFVNRVLNVIRMSNSIKKKIEDSYKAPIHKLSSNGDDEINFSLWNKIILGKEAFETALQNPIDLSSNSNLFGVDELWIYAIEYFNNHQASLDWEHVEGLLEPTYIKLFPGEKEEFMMRTLQQMVKSFDSLATW